MSGLRSPDPVELSWSAAPTRELLRLAWPITISTLSFSAMGLASTAFVSFVGKDELAGVGLAGVASFALICFGIGLLRGAKTLVSQAIGAGRRDRVDSYLGAAVGLAIGLGVLATLAGQALAPLVAMLCASPRAGGFASEFLTLRSLAAPVVLVTCALREARYGEGDSRAPMHASLWGNATNIAVDVVLIFGLGWGVTGAALGTIAGSLVEFAVMAWPMRARLARLRWRRDAARAVWAQGVPNGVQFVMEVGAFMLLTGIIARMSSAEAGAHQMVLHLINVSFLPAHALAEAAAVLVGQAVGAGRHGLVPTVAGRALMLGGAYAALCSIALGFAGPAITRGLSGGDASLAAAATALVHVGLTFMVADAANVIARGVLRGASDVRFAAVVGIVTSWVTTPPLTWLLGVRAGLGATGGWIGLTLEIFVGAAVFWLRVWRGGWRAAAEASRREIVAT